MPLTPDQTRTARDLAFSVLDEYQSTGAFAGPLLERQARASTLPSSEVRLATEITLGVIRRQATLDALITPHVRRPRQHVEDALWSLIQIGVYQLVFASSIPPHAALHETVETARRAGHPRWTGFLNGVLRSVARDLSDELTDAPAADAVPVASGRYRRCLQPRFDDPQTASASYFAAAFSFPRWLTDRWIGRFSFDDLCTLGFWFDAAPTLFLRVNGLQTSRPSLLEALTAAGVEASPGHRPESVRLGRSQPIDRLPGFAKGWFAVQDESAMNAAALLAPRAGERVLDLGAAPGTKSTHLAELMQNEGTIVAADISAERLERVEENRERLRLPIIQPLLVRPDLSDLPPGPFDAILFDAPCSNTGVLGRRPEARWRLQPEEIDELSALQRRLLRAAVERLRPGGRLVYSTCSIEPEENQEVVRDVLGQRPGLRLVEEQEHRPGQPADGAYQALLQREE